MADKAPLGKEANINSQQPTGSLDPPLKENKKAGENGSLSVGTEAGENCSLSVEKETGANCSLSVGNAHKASTCHEDQQGQEDKSASFAPCMENKMDSICSSAKGQRVNSINLDTVKANILPSNWKAISNINNNPLCRILVGWNPSKGGCSISSLLSPMAYL
ncbi:hypothetical protein OIU74_021351 [Salix koriyanagi]|uniref:Uncharacterized protein n=1 Tax=Salix koriyanagi TaxID=2511006 RepID=A0A9Q1ADS0_9ROSI|nr:hypothetical protein OIU74_021351 [Salix koriyanagi]